MKNIGNFLVGTLSSFGVAQALPDSIQSAVNTHTGVIDSIEALVSLLSGILSAFLIAWLKKKWENKSKSL